ncbi:uncharacterized protein LOC116339725 [Contarinia nasturtii]|uniref:uncharacterized protein LOC116339725 n=1 Tax=Contarinia nasturtii TaxID=265458 RepID=UPI0012D48754|nr:uncharacterized protein LOC116339725 [Contarinia nasturtii]
MAIPSAIDFILNRTYEDEYLALNCQNAKDKNPNKQYVKLYISSDMPFKLNGKTSKHFVVTRYLSEGRIGFVYFKKMKQMIKKFHEEMAQHKFIRINDLIISERTLPTNFDWNQIFVSSLAGQSIIELIKENEFATTCPIPIALLYLERRRMDEAKKLLIKLRTNGAAILKNQLHGLGEKRPNEVHDARAKQRELKLSMEADKYEDIQRSHFMDYQMKIDAIQDAELGLRPFNEILVRWVCEEKQYKHPQLTIGDVVTDCEKLIVAAENRIQSLNDNEDYKKIQRLVREKRQNIRNYQNEIADAVSKRLESQINSVIRSRNLLQCTNQSTKAQMIFEEFFETQTILEPASILSWRAGLMALTLPSAFDLNVTPNFIGNMLDYIEPTLDEHTLKIIVPFLCEYFTSFIFKTKAASDDFMDIVKPLLKNGGHIYAYSIEEFYPLCSTDLPYTSLSLLQVLNCDSPETGNYFDNFRICTENVAIDIIQDDTIKHHCNIIQGTKCYFYDGHIVTNNCNEDDVMNVFLDKWQKVKTQRDIKIKSEHKIFTSQVEVEIDAGTYEHVGNIEDFIITEHLKFALSLKNHRQMTDSLISWEKLIMQQDAEINANKMKLDMIEANYQDPVTHLQQIHFERYVPDAVNKAIIEFEKQAMNRLNGANVMDLLPVGGAFNRNIEELKNSLPALETFDYKQQFNVSNMVPENEMMQMCKQVVEHNEHMKKYQQTLCKFNKIQKYPDLMDDVNTIQIPADANYYDLLKGVPDGLYLPDLDADFDYILMHFKDLPVCYELVEQGAIETSTNMAIISSEMFFATIYYKGLVNIAKYLNKLIDPADGVIGFGIEFGHQREFVFPDTNFDEDWVLNQEQNRHTNNREIKIVCVKWYKDHEMKKLCDKCTGLSFVTKTKGTNNVIAPSDLFDVKCHRFGLLFHLALSITTNPSLTILNRSIIGHPRDSLQNIIQRFLVEHDYEDVDNGDNVLDKKMLEMILNARQLIVVSRKQNDYDSILVQGFKRFTCNKDGGDFCITTETVIPIEDHQN